MIYVVAQFLLLVVLVWPIVTLHFSFTGATLVFCSLLVAFFALISNRPGNFNVSPIPKSSGQLITTGIYRYIRHPMYCSLFFVGLAILFCQFSLWKLFAWILLLLILTLKSREEERALIVHYPDYKNYQKTSKAFIPLLW